MRYFFKNLPVLVFAFLLLQVVSTNCMLRNAAKTRSLLTAMKTRNFASHNKRYDYLFITVRYWMRSNFQNDYRLIITEYAQDGWRFKDVVIPPNGPYEANMERVAEIIFERAVKKSQ